MIQLIGAYWYLLILIFIVGAFFYGFNQNKLKEWFNDFSNKAPIIKKYWIFVIPFFIVTAGTLYWIFKNTDESKQELYISLTGQIATLIFAAYAGYLAFQQLMENRLDKLREYGDSYLLRKHYRRAIEYYSEILKINPRDYNALANILEIYLFNENFEKFEEKFPLLSRIALEDSEKLVCKYLAATRYLLEEYNSKAKGKIDEIIKYTKDNPHAIKYMDWNFEDIKNSIIYEKIQGDSKKMFDNLIKYLSKRIDEVNKKRFENGDYLLNPADSA